jgi:23S rRNA (uracil1939-C5)-methyltransferase
MAETQDVDIVRIGAQGDGIAGGGGAPLYVPFTLAGERVRIEAEDGRVRLVKIVQASADRVAPICRHFGRCGGCALQHMADDAYRRWKRDQVIAAFDARGVNADVGVISALAGLRRRAVMTARNSREGVLLGYHMSGSHDLVDVAECPVLLPSIVAALPRLRQLIAPLLPRRESARIAITATLGGLDLALSGISKDLTAVARSHLARDARSLRLARVSVEEDVVFEEQAPIIRFGTADVVVPPGVFIQAVEQAEREMVALIIAAIGKAKHVADLFSGVGAFSLPVAMTSRVSAFDGDVRAIAALAASVKRTSGLKPLAAHRRDLFREPLSALELRDFDAVVFDPPRAGAEAQSRMLAKSKVKTVVAVSCNPATLARDSRILIDGGYALVSIAPIDQFKFSPHVEVVAVFRR